MIHIIKSRKGYEVVTFTNGNLGMFTAQGYSRRAGAIKRIQRDMKDYGGAECIVQDDTTPTPTTLLVPLKGKPTTLTAIKTKPKYVPAKKK